jgi:hypothetical protein
MEFLFLAHNPGNTGIDKPPAAEEDEGSQTYDPSFCYLFQN